MFLGKKKYHILTHAIENLSKTMQEGNLHELTYLLGSKKQIIWRNLLAGIFRGIGIGIGVTVVTALLIYVLQKMVTLNIPIIGEYIADIVEIVQRSR